MLLVKEAIARVKALYNKGKDSDDSRLSDRHIYAKLVSARSLLVKREIDKNRTPSDWIMQTIPCLKLIDAAPNECPCIPPAGCAMKRSVSRLPKPIQSRIGPELEAVTTMDGSIIFSRTTWIKKKYKAGDKYTNFKPDYFIKDGYLFITSNLTDDDLLVYISVSGAFEDPLEILYVDTCEKNCFDPLEAVFPIDGHLLDAIIQLATQELVSVFKATPEDQFNDARDPNISVSSSPSPKTAPE
jgi:hypothetical protein|tara:strand:+ start:179 stop:904 length:726 start_codon:yes stop_codon:yes gene_type:complete